MSIQDDHDKRIEELGLADAYRLTMAVHDKAVSLLTSYGTVLSTPHSDALFHLAGCLTMLALGKAGGRYAFDLGTGCGKTTLAVSFVAALSAARRTETVAIASERVEGLCQLYRDLIGAGVPAEQIGLRHNYQHDPEQRQRFLDGKPLRDGFASEPSTTVDLSEFPYVLYTHNRVFMSGSSADALQQLSAYRGQRRNLIVWDEALLSSQHVSVHWPTFERQLAALRATVDFPDGKHEELRPLVAHFERCSRILKTEWFHQRDNGTGEPARVFKLPPLIMGTELPEKALGQFHNLGDAYTGELLSVLEQSNRPARLVSTASGVVSFDVAVPDALRNVAILDASAPIRKLMEADASIQRWQGLNGKGDPFNGRIVDYSNVVIRWAKAGAGRSTVEGDKRHALVNDVVRVVQQIPKDEAVLIFTFKPRAFNRDTLTRLRTKLDEAGVSLTDTLEFRGQRRPRLVFLTWGMETSLSQFQYCSNVLTCGVLERSDWDLAGAIAGQRRDLQTDITTDTLRDIKLSEAAHILYQAFSRGSARVIVNGKASPMNVWLCHREADHLQETLSTGPAAVMPGAVWLPWETEYLPQWSKIGAAVAALRAALPMDTQKMLIRDWRARAGVDRTMERDLFREARDLALEGTDWLVSGPYIEKPHSDSEQTRQKEGDGG